MVSDKEGPEIRLGLGPGIPILAIPAEAVIVDEFDPISGNVPTLLSVERIIGRVGDLQVVLRDEHQVLRIAEVVNRDFLQRSPKRWRSVDLDLSAAIAPPDLVPVVQAVGSLREPALREGVKILEARTRQDLSAARSSEDALVSEMQAAVKGRPEIFRKDASVNVGGLIARTALHSLVNGLVGVPITTIIRTALGGVLRRFE